MLLPAATGEACPEILPCRSGRDPLSWVRLLPDNGPGAAWHRGNTKAKACAKNDPAVAGGVTDMSPVANITGDVQVILPARG